MSNPNESPAAASAQTLVPLVVIAASAGGLDPISEILDYYPSTQPVATVVIQHLSPAYRSELVNLLQAHTHQPVHGLHDACVLKPGNVYVIQPGTQIVIEGNTIHTMTRDDSERPYFTIDVFLESVARRGDPSNACVVLLSGTGSDGTMGCRAVHDSGGYVLVQQLSDAKFDGMPLSVINSGAYDEVQPARLISSRISAWLENGMQRPLPPQDYQDSDPLALLYADSDNGHLQTDINPYAGIFELMRATFDLDLNSYKIGTIDRRITQRMRRLGFTTIQQYQKLLAQGGNEPRALFSDLMIGVTSFFRNPQVFELLESRVLPDLLDRGDGSLKLWVCGCSTGEEAYSIAMLLQKLVNQRGGSHSFRIYATDINADAIRKASEATFDYGTLQPFINRFGLQEFITTNEDYGRLRVVKEVRRNIIFSVQNVLKHSPLHALDMILCRNMLIYLRPEAQRKVISNFHFGLKDGGILVLGESEGPAGLEPYFSEVDARLKLFTKKAGVQLSPSDRWQLNRSVAPLSSIRTISHQRESVHLPVARGAFEAAFSTVAGHSLIVRSDGDIQYVTGKAGELFSRAAPGRPTLNLHTHISDMELQALLQMGIGEASESADSIQWQFSYKHENSDFQFDFIRFTRLSAALEREPSILVQLIEAPSEEKSELVHVTKATDVLAALQSGEGGLGRLSALERENSQLRQLVKESVQDKETFHEELQSANEELLSSNEELQSTNEELQSVNEELHSVNAELEEKIRQLSEANSDITNLLSSTDVALIFLDDQLCIRRFTEVARNYFPLGMQDIGRPIEDLVSNFNRLDISAIGKEIVATSKIQRHETTTSDGKWLQVMFFPYSDQESNTRGVVVTIYDITLMRHLLQQEKEVRLRRELAEQKLRICHWAIPDLDKDFIEIDALLPESLGYTAEEFGHSLSKLYTHAHPDDAESLRQAMTSARAENTSFSVEVRFQTRDGKELWSLCNGAVHIGAEGEPAMLGLIVDIDSRKRNEISLNERQANDRHNNRIFNIGMLVSGVAHELNNPLSALQLGNEQLQTLIENEKLDPAILRKIALNQGDAVTRMDRIISSLLRFARKDENSATRRIHVSDLLQDVDRLTRPMANESSVQLEVAEVSKQLVLECHPLELAQALVNMVTNAIQHTAGQPDAWVKVVVEKQTKSLAFKVIDSGLTSNISSPERMFIPFYTTKEVGRGTGLGLPLSQGIAEAHGGSLTLDGTAKNTTFVMNIPSQVPVIK